MSYEKKIFFVAFFLGGRERDNGYNTTMRYTLNMTHNLPIIVWSDRENGSCVSVRQVLILSLYLAVLFTLYLVPLGMYSPCIKDEGTLGPAPILIGHRGAPMVCYFNLTFLCHTEREHGGF